MARWRRELLDLSPPFAAGALLRLWNLPAQVLGGDELHAVRAALARPLAEALVTYGSVDPCPPLAGWDRALIGLGVPLTETLARLPVLTAGLAAVIALPLAARHRLGGRGAAIFTWLLALAPLLVLYSRVARPYAAVALLGPLAVLAFDRWWWGGGWGWGVGYALAAAATVWLHPLAAAFVLAPFAFAVGWLALGRRGARTRPGDVPGPVALVALGIGTAALLATFLVPALPSLRTVLAAKAGGGWVSWPSAGSALMLFSGSAAVPVTIGVWALAIAGWGLLARRHPPFALMAVTALAAHGAALLVLRPFGLDHPLILARYLIVALPLVLAGVAAAVAAIGEGPGGWRSRALPGLLVAVLLASGPLVDEPYRTSSFTTHNDFLAFHRPLASAPAVPGFYGVPAASGFYGVPAASEGPINEVPNEAPAASDTHEVPSASGALLDAYEVPAASGALVELPWPSPWRFARSFYAYQRGHRRPVTVATPELVLTDPRLAWRNLAPATPEGLARSGARYVVVHRDLAAEEARLVPPGDMPAPRARRLRHFAAALAAKLEAAWGPPAYADGAVQVWDLRRRTAGDA